jgi:hypothetical protein
VWAERRFKARKGVVGVGQQQVIQDGGRGERAIAVSIRVYLLLRRLTPQHIPVDTPCAFALQRTFVWEGIDEQCTRAAKRLAQKWLQKPKAT